MFRLVAGWWRKQQYFCGEDGGRDVLESEVKHLKRISGVLKCNVSSPSVAGTNG
jgi:hypothetical protein